MNNYSIHTDLACESEASHDGGKQRHQYSETDKTALKLLALPVLDKTGEEANR